MNFMNNEEPIKQKIDFYKQLLATAFIAGNIIWLISNTNHPLKAFSVILALILAGSIQFLFFEILRNIKKLEV